MINILFVCSGNSVRSQMAEGLCRAMTDGNCEVKSAGVMPIGVHPVTIASMKEIDIDISAHTSSLLSRSMLDWADYVITLCNSLLIGFPAMPPKTRHIHWDIPNPDRNYDSDEKRSEGFAKVRNTVKENIAQLLEEVY